MKLGLLTIVFLLLASCSYAQVDTIRLKDRGPYADNKIVTDRPPQALYFGIGGSGPLFSVNYDRRFGKRLNGLGFTAGLGFFGGSGAAVFSIPASLNYLFGKQSHFLELAAGATFATAAFDTYYDDNESDNIVFGHVNVGYRYQPAKGGFFARTGVSPIIAGGGYFTSFYVGLGYCF